MDPPQARLELPIRKPPAEVFAAFADPRTLEAFWLARASGPLAPGARVDWEFLVPGARETVVVTRFEPGAAIGFDWTGGKLSVLLEFAPWADGGTRLSVAVSGFAGEDAAAQPANAVEGFAIVLCDFKCLLETGRSPGLVRDKARLIAAG